MENIVTELRQSYAFLGIDEEVRLVSDETAAIALPTERCTLRISRVGREDLDQSFRRISVDEALERVVNIDRRAILFACKDLIEETAAQLPLAGQIAVRKVMLRDGGKVLVNGGDSVLVLPHGWDFGILVKRGPTYQPQSLPPAGAVDQIDP